jgi:uncharacterized protein (TIGR03067 family)
LSASQALRSSARSGRITTLLPSRFFSSSALSSTQGIGPSSPGLGLLAADDPAKAEQDKRQGTWVIASLEVAGDEVPKEQLEGITLTIEGDKHTVKRGDDVLAERTCKLDPTKSPKQIDGKYVGGPNDGKATLGIYELNGDTLKYCFDVLFELLQQAEVDTLVERPPDAVTQLP